MQRRDIPQRPAQRLSQRLLITRLQAATQTTLSAQRANYTVARAPGLSQHNDQVANTCEPISFDACDTRTPSSLPQKVHAAGFMREPESKSKNNSRSCTLPEAMQNEPLGLHAPRGCAALQRLWGCTLPEAALRTLEPSRTRACSNLVTHNSRKLYPTATTSPSAANRAKHLPGACR